MKVDRHALEADLSWKLHRERQRQKQATLEDESQYHHHQNHHRQLKKKHHEMTEEEKGDKLEEEEEREFLEHQEQVEKKKAAKHRKKAKEFEESVKTLYNHTGIKSTRVHGMMIDAGSKGSRIHLYEWKPRVLNTREEIEAAVEGAKLSFPESDTRWTNRIRPGIDEFAYLPDDELVPAIGKYLLQFLDFAKTILHDQVDDWGDFPIFLKATGGLRIVDTKNRARVIGAVRDLFSNKTYCPFQFTKEQARVISGEEEAIYDWTNVNFLLGVLLPESQGAGTVR